MDEKERKFNPVSDNYEKQQTFREMIKKYNKAVQNGFYLEAILIDYALMEDRLHSCMYHLGLLSKRNDIKVLKNRAKNTIKQWMVEYLPNEKPYFCLTKISGKRKILLATFYRFQSDMPCDSKNRYESAVFRAYSRKNVDIDTAVEYINKCEEWCEYRNEIIHALFNKNLTVVNEKLVRLAEEGFEISRYIDKICSWIKWRNEIRRSVKLKCE